MKTLTLLTFLCLVWVEPGLLLAPAPARHD
jgi:hypothetical protein